MFLDNQRSEDCCGCAACSNICNFSAITMKQNAEGFYYPEVDKDKCRDCGMCQKVCPMQDNYVGQTASPAIYAARNHDENILKDSSSGGMFTLLADWTLKQKGVVYGVAFDENYYVRHMRAETEEEVSKFRRSKYVESDVTEVYTHIADDLKQNRVVLFTGTPCQVAGITKYLKARRVNTEKFYTCDNICHGVPSRKLWRDYLDILKKKYIAADDEIMDVNMRSKKISWRQQTFDVKLKKGNIDNIVREFSFNKIFQGLYGNRSSCFKCRYTSYKRPGDFTIGDFWTSEKVGRTFDTESGVSVIFANTQKAETVLNDLREAADFKEVSAKECWQPHLEYAAKAPGNRAKFWEEYLSAPDREVVLRKYIKGALGIRIIRFLSPLLRKTGLYGFAGKMYKLIIVKKRS